MSKMEDKKKSSSDDMPIHRKAKMDMLQSLRKMAMDMIHSRGEATDSAGDMPKGPSEMDENDGAVDSTADAAGAAEGMAGERDEDSEDTEESLQARLDALRAKKKQQA